MAVPEIPEVALAEFLADIGNSTLDLTTAMARCTEAMGLQHSVAYLADLQQRQLTPLNDLVRTLPIDDSLAGWTYRTQSLRTEESDFGGMTAWLPLVDGAERLGVLAVRAPALDPLSLRRGKTLASLFAMMITSKRAYKDFYARQTRTEPMRLAAEMLRAFLPPRTIGSTRAVSTAVLEPAYDVGGDAFDHALTDSVLHTAILDAMGHDLASGLTSVVSLAACRNARRTGADLPELVECVDAALSKWLPDQFCTAVVSQLNLSTGKLRWINCGHPAPLLIRDHRLVAGAMDRDADPPMGMPAAFTSTPRRVHEIALEPDDRVLMFTDGVTEARTMDGGEIGLERFADYVARAAAAGELASETLRRLIQAILDAQENRLRDDATILMFEWRHPPLPV